MGNNGALCLYNEEGETVFCSGNYREIGEFLGRSLDNTYTAVSRIKHGAMNHVYDKDGNKYTAEIINEYPTDLQAIIDMAIEYIYENGILDLNGYDLLKILENGGNKNDI